MDFTEGILPPGAIKGARRRYRQTNAHTDQSDAWLIADVLRTDPATLHPWRPDGLIVRQRRAKVSFLQCLTKEVRRLSNRLQALLARYYPAALHVFYDPASPIALRFLQAFPTPDQAARLTRQAFGQFARANRYRQSNAVLSAAYARLQAAYPVASPTTVAAYRDEAVWLAQHLLSVLEQKKVEIARLQVLFQQHSDHELFASLPGAGDFLAPALLAKFGDDRERFPQAASLQALAGTCPVTEQSGKGRRAGAWRKSRWKSRIPKNTASAKTPCANGWRLTKPKALMASNREGARIKVTPEKFPPKFLRKRSRSRKRRRNTASPRSFLSWKPRV
ncbi:MAG: IS110 family transposase [candidate division KSB1 bacterium]|nr:IS110 family transposase [candidate division KSB1 bacterium]MDZ7369224.1 IS110 family transposase [candidate division KSB1 bacterium]MDZ7407197.1 IS110 family transposase [candidate division KSB1 bacterium]